jgi:hypothetical protein
MHDYDRNQLEDGLEGDDTQDNDLGAKVRVPPAPSRSPRRTS